MIAHQMIGSIMDTAERINVACDARKLDLADPLRPRAHRMHGELIARGADDPDEVLRMVESMLDREMQQELGGQGG